MKKVFLMMCCCVVIMACKGQDHGDMKSMKEATPVMVTEAAPASQDILSTTDLRAEIDAMIGDRACDTDDQCHAVGLGSRACGGFDQFEVYSSKNTDPKMITEKAKAYFEATKIKNEEEGMMSICAIEIEPKTKCLANQCVIDVMASLPNGEMPQ